jgi:hypothetical protein
VCVVLPREDWGVLHNHIASGILLENAGVGIQVRELLKLTGMNPIDCQPPAVVLPLHNSRLQCLDETVSFSGELTREIWRAISRGEQPKNPSFFSCGTPSLRLTGMREYGELSATLFTGSIYCEKVAGFARIAWLGAITGIVRTTRTTSRRSMQLAVSHQISQQLLQAAPPVQSPT